MPVTKTKNRIGKIEILSNRAIGLFMICVLGAVIVLVTPLIHIYFPVKTMETVEYEELLASRSKEIDGQLISLKNQYNREAISSEAFVIENNLLQFRREKQTRENKEALVSFVESQRIFGWKSPRKFLIAFGLRLPYLFFAIIISWLVIKIKNEDKNLFNALFILQIGCYSSAFYQLVWVFWYSQDYSLKTYRVAVIAFCILAASFATYFMRYFKSTNILIFKTKIRYIMNLMAKQAVVKGHIKDEDKYEEEIVYPALKKLNER